ncbi:hypothetical protein MRX96_039123 [Rhipicephalus microplus]
MPAAPKVAYVVYDDGYRAIVSVKLIKDFKPASVADCQKHKEIYWKTNEAGHVDEGYYRGDVILLGETLASRSCCGHQCSTSTNHGAYEHEATHRSIQEKHLLLPEPPSPSSEQPRMQPCPLMPPVPHPGTTSSGSQEPTSQGLGASDELPLFFQVDNQTHLGNGIFLEQEKWAWLLSRPRDSLFCKEATKLLCGVSALHNRSITGAPCRRYVRSENQASPRRALTPKKLEAVGNAFSKYIAGRPSETAPMERLRKMNRFIAEMLNDLNK